MDFETTIIRKRKRDALELLALAKDATSDDELSEYEEIECGLEVFYNPGYFVAGNWHHPPEGENAELTSVVLTREDGETEEIIGDLSVEEHHALVEQANRDQELYDQDGADPDAYDNARDMAMEDEHYDCF